MADVPMRLGRYTLGPMLGAGGQGAVYRATTAGHGGVREVALKVLTRGGGDALVREARLGGLLRHANLVDVYEVGEDDGTWFCAMELCEGGSLSGRGPLPPRAVIEVGLQVCAALGYAHRELGLVHLDLKPANLLLRGATVKVGDLGIARTGVDQDPMAWGTQGYAAPELVARQPVDARADVYSLGVVLQVLATGCSPRTAETWDLFDLDPQPSHEAGDVPGWLEPVLRACLAPAPEERPPTMEALAALLRTLEVDGPGLEAVLGEPIASGSADLVPFVGRERELRALADGWGDHRCVTLWGPPGIGKTRLADEVMRRWRADGRAAVRVDAEQLTTTIALCRALATTLGISPGTPRLEATIAQVLAHRGSVLVVVDAAEGLQARELPIAGWLAACPEAGFLLTSRVPLGMASEHIVEVSPLDATDARALVVARAHLRGVALEPSDPAMERLVAELDGVPLALELAAGRLGVLSVDEVVARLGVSFLRSGRGEGRGTSLQAALGASWDHLDEAERRCLAQLSVFDGGATLDAVEAVVSGVADVVGCLESLRRRALVSVADGRIRLLRPVAAFAAEQRDPSDGAEERHGAWVAGLLDPAKVEAELAEGAGRRRWARELPNLWAAARRAEARGDVVCAGRALCVAAAVDIANGGDGPVLELAQRLDPLLTEPLRAQVRLAEIRWKLRRGRWKEALALAVRARAEGAPLPARIEGRLALLEAQLLLSADRVDEAARLGRAVVAGADGNGDARLSAAAHLHLASCARYRGSTEACRTLLAAAAHIYRRLGVQSGLAQVLHTLSDVQNELGDVQPALRNAEEASRLWDGIGDVHWRVYAGSHRAKMLVRVGRCDEALALAEETLSLARSHGASRPWGAAALARGWVVLALGEVDDAVASLVEAREMKDRSGFTGDVSVAIALILAHQLGDRVAEAHAELELANRRLSTAGDRVFRFLVHECEARLMLAAGRPEAALAAFPEPLGGSPATRARLALLRGEAAAILGRPDAADLLAEATARVASAGTPEVGLHETCTRARLLARSGDRAGAEALLGRIVVGRSLVPRVRVDLRAARALLHVG